MSIIIHVPYSTMTLHVYCTNTHIQNIELQVQLDNLKKELGEKDKLLMQAK